MQIKKIIEKKDIQKFIKSKKKGVKSCISLIEKSKGYVSDLEKIKIEVEQSKKIFKKNKWPTIDVTRKSVEETAASVIKIYEII